MKYIVTSLFMCVVVALSASAQENLLKNGDFETGNDGSWILKPHKDNENTATIASENGVEGSRYAKLGVMNKKLEAGFEQPLTLESGSKYVFSGVCYYAAAPTNGRTAKIQILSSPDRSVLQEIDIPVDKIYNPSNSGTLTKEKAEKDLTVKFDIEDNISGNVLLSFTNGGIDKLIRFDNLSVTKSSSTGIADATIEKMYIKTGNGNIVVSGQYLSQIAIYSVTGQLVRKTNMNGAEEYVADGLQGGIYVVKAGNLARKVIIQ